MDTNVTQSLFPVISLLGYCLFCWNYRRR